MVKVALAALLSGYGVRRVDDWAWVGGFALHEAFGRRVADVSDPRVVQFPHLVAVRSRLGVLGSRGLQKFRT